MTQKSVHPSTLPMGLPGDYFETHRLKYNLLVFFFLWLFRRDKLWICMEYCGGGSLQDIYHGKIHHTKVNNQLLTQTQWSVFQCCAISPFHSLFKGIVCPEMTILSSFIHPHLVPNPYEFISSVKHNMFHVE